MPDDLGDRRIMVNIPEFHLKAIDGDREVLDIRAIVGRAGDETPVLSKDMTTVVFSPYWNIPETIATDETLPEIANDPGFPRAQQHRGRAGGRWAAGSRRSCDSTRLERCRNAEGFSFRQRPGSQNALGLVKFLFPNPHNVYVHDTPGGPSVQPHWPVVQSRLHPHRATDRACAIRAARSAPVDAGSHPAGDECRRRAHVKLTEPIPVHLDLLHGVDGRRTAA